MRAFIAFTKKEFVESLRTLRVFVLAVVFIFFGVTSPLTAKILPELINSMDLGDDLKINLPEPSALDSWAQFFKNVGQTGMLTLIIIFCGITANELSRGTLINLLTKGMKRHTVILSKFLSASVLWTASYLLCLGICYAYTEYIWADDVIYNAFSAFLSLWLFGEFLISLLILGGILLKNFYGSLFTCFGVTIAMSLLNIIPYVNKYNPIVLASDTLNLLSSQKAVSDFIPAMIVCTCGIILLLVISIVTFNKKQL